jgi:hypothetical protein
MNVQFIRKVHNKIQADPKKKPLKVCKTNNKIQTNKRKKTDSKMEFDVQQIIIQIDSRIVIVTIAKIPILPVPNETSSLELNLFFTIGSVGYMYV